MKAEYNIDELGGIAWEAAVARTAKIIADEFGIEPHWTSIVIIAPKLGIKYDVNGHIINK